MVALDSPTGPGYARTHPRLDALDGRSFLKRLGGIGIEPLDADVAELDRVGVAAEAEVPRLEVLARVRAVGHELLHVGQIRVEDDVAVQLDLDLRALDGRLLEVPLPGRPLVAPVGRHHAV